MIDLDRQTKLPTYRKLLFGLGTVAFGVKNNGFDYFLLIFYSQVLGVPATLIGLALFLALLVDAVSDPLVGYLSDNTKTRWGRRHPWMYASALPVSLAYCFLWMPSENWSNDALFAYVFVLSVLIRIFITFYEVPSAALSAELTDDYRERTSIISYRMFFAWVGGVGIGAFALTFFLVPNDTVESGLMNIQGYRSYGVTGAIVMFLSIIISSVGTHGLISRMNERVQVSSSVSSSFSFSGAFVEIGDTIRNKSFAALFASAMFAAIATGVYATLSYYVSGYFFEFDNRQIALMSVSIVLSAILAFAITPVISRGMDKKPAAIVFGILSLFFMILPISLRLIGLLPSNGTEQLFYILLMINIIGVVFIIVFQTLIQSMIADLVEDIEVRTSRRSEGVIFSAMTFIRKATHGIGLLVATFVLTIVSFPKEAAPGDVPIETIREFGIVLIPVLLLLWIATVIVLRWYAITREHHLENLAKLNRMQS